jgi:hypothetical protein
VNKKFFNLLHSSVRPRARGDRHNCPDLGLTLADQVPHFVQRTHSRIHQIGLPLSGLLNPDVDQVQ